MGKELAFTTSAFISTDNLETFYAKKSDVICFWFPLRCVSVNVNLNYVKYVINR